MAGRVRFTPYERLDQTAAIEAFRSLPTRDRDLLYAEKSGWVARLRRQATLAAAVAGIGGFLAAFGILPWLGVGLIGLGWLGWRRARGGAVAVEAAFASLVGQIQDLQSSFRSAASARQSDLDRLPKASTTLPKVGSTPPPVP